MCADVGTISGHTLSDYVANDILPTSIWDLKHRPVCSPEGMVYDEETNKWVDVYLASGTGSSTASAYGATITDTHDWNDFVDDGHAVKKRLPTDEEFQSFAAGSNEQTDIVDASDPITTGGHSDTASRRMISNIGCEDCCGAVFQWLLTPSVRLDDGTSAIWIDLGKGKGAFLTYGDHGYGNDQLLAGGSWTLVGNDCGSLCRVAATPRGAAYADLGARFVAEPL